DNAATALAARLRTTLGDRVLGPQEPPIARIQNKYLTRIMLKYEKGQSPSYIKKIVNDAIDAILSNHQWKSVSIYADVDPL
ncbi:MAG: hypothetical protein PWQ06_1678, partial [Anaerophaga sp.]|nr:hypothetical protein [Anaerophaga sp.]